MADINITSNLNKVTAEQKATFKTLSNQITTISTELRSALQSTATGDKETVETVSNSSIDIKNQVISGTTTIADQYNDLKTRITVAIADGVLSETEYNELTDKLNNILSIINIIGAVNNQGYVSSASVNSMATAINKNLTTIFKLGTISKSQLSKIDTYIETLTNLKTIVSTNGQLTAMIDNLITDINTAKSDNVLTEAEVRSLFTSIQSIISVASIYLESTEAIETVATNIQTNLNTIATNLNSIETEILTGDERWTNFTDLVDDYKTTINSGFINNEYKKDTASRGNAYTKIKEDYKELTKLIETVSSDGKVDLAELANVKAQFGSFKNYVTSIVEIWKTEANVNTRITQYSQELDSKIDRSIETLTSTVAEKVNQGEALNLKNDLLDNLIKPINEAAVILYNNYQDTSLYAKFYNLLKEIKTTVENGYETYKTKVVQNTAVATTDYQLRAYNNSTVAPSIKTTGTSVQVTNTVPNSPIYDRHDYQCVIPTPTLPPRPPHPTQTPGCWLRPRIVQTTLSVSNVITTAAPVNNFMSITGWVITGAISSSSPKFTPKLKNGKLMVFDEDWITKYGENINIIISSTKYASIIANISSYDNLTSNYEDNMNKALELQKATALLKVGLTDSNSDITSAINQLKANYNKYNREDQYIYSLITDLETVYTDANKDDKITTDELTQIWNRVEDIQDAIENAVTADDFADYLSSSGLTDLLGDLTNDISNAVNNATGKLGDNINTVSGIASNAYNRADSAYSYAGSAYSYAGTAKSTADTINQNNLIAAYWQQVVSLLNYYNTAFGFIVDGKIGTSETAAWNSVISKIQNITLSNIFTNITNAGGAVDNTYKTNAQNASTAVWDKIKTATTWSSTQIESIKSNLETLNTNIGNLVNQYNNNSNGTLKLLSYSIANELGMLADGIVTASEKAAINQSIADQKTSLEESIALAYANAEAAKTSAETAYSKANTAWSTANAASTAATKAGNDAQKALTDASNNLTTANDNARKYLKAYSELIAGASSDGVIDATEMAAIKAAGEQLNTALLNQKKAQQKTKLELDKQPVYHNYLQYAVFTNAKCTTCIASNNPQIPVTQTGGLQIITGKSTIKYVEVPQTSVSTTLKATTVYPTKSIVANTVPQALVIDPTKKATYTIQQTEDKCVEGNKLYIRVYKAGTNTPITSGDPLFTINHGFDTSTTDVKLKTSDCKWWDITPNVSDDFEFGIWENSGRLTGGTINYNATNKCFEVPIKAYSSINESSEKITVSCGNPMIDNKLEITSATSGCSTYKTNNFKDLTDTEVYGSSGFTHHDFIEESSCKFNIELIPWIVVESDVNIILDNESIVGSNSIFEYEYDNTINGWNSNDGKYTPNYTQSKINITKTIEVELNNVAKVRIQLLNRDKCIQSCKVDDAEAIDISSKTMPYIYNGYTTDSLGNQTITITLTFGVNQGSATLLVMPVAYEGEGYKWKSSRYSTIFTLTGNDVHTITVTNSGLNWWNSAANVSLNPVSITDKTKNPYLCRLDAPSRYTKFSNINIAGTNVAIPASDTNSAVGDYKYYYKKNTVTPDYIYFTYNSNLTNDVTVDSTCIDEVNVVNLSDKWGKLSLTGYDTSNTLISIPVGLYKYDNGKSSIYIRVYGNVNGTTLDTCTNVSIIFKAKDVTTGFKLLGEEMTLTQIYSGTKSPALDPEIPRPTGIIYTKCMFNTPSNNDGLSWDADQKNNPYEISCLNRCDSTSKIDATNSYAFGNGGGLIACTVVQSTNAPQTTHAEYSYITTEASTDKTKLSYGPNILTRDSHINLMINWNGFTLTIDRPLTSNIGDIFNYTGTYTGSISGKYWGSSRLNTAQIYQIGVKLPGADYVKVCSLVLKTSENKRNIYRYSIDGVTYATRLADAATAMADANTKLDSSSISSGIHAIKIYQGNRLVASKYIQKL